MFNLFFTFFRFIPVPRSFPKKIVVVVLLSSYRTSVILDTEVYGVLSGFHKKKLAPF